MASTYNLKINIKISSDNMIVDTLYFMNVAKIDGEIYSLKADIKPADEYHPIDVVVIGFPTKSSLIDLKDSFIVCVYKTTAKHCTNNLIRNIARTIEYDLFNYGLGDM